MVAVEFIPRGENANIFISHVRDDVKLFYYFLRMNSPATINLSLCDVSKKQIAVFDSLQIIVFDQILMCISMILRQLVFNARTIFLTIFPVDPIPSLW
jgi:hypothetical protein